MKTGFLTITVAAPAPLLLSRPFRLRQEHLGKFREHYRGEQDTITKTHEENRDRTHASRSSSRSGGVVKYWPAAESGFCSSSLRLHVLPRRQKASAQAIRFPVSRAS